jgi:signal transduction histidine kinase
VLKIVAQAFSTSSAAYYDHHEGEDIYLRYWMNDWVLHGPDDFRSDGTEFMDAVVSLSKGFTLPDDYLGGPCREMTEVSVLDHFLGTSMPEYDRIAIDHGRGRELRIPLVVGGKADGAVIAYRTEPYTSEELSLATTLSKQLALGVQLNQSASATLQMSMARERERAAEDRANELIQIHDQLRDSLIQISSGIAYEERLRRVLHSACLQLRSAGACIFLYEPLTDQLRILATAENSESTLAGEMIVPARCMAPFPASDLALWNEFQQTPDPVVLDVRLPEYAKRIRPEAVPWHLENRRYIILGLPLVIERRVLGYLSVTFESLESVEMLSNDKLLIGKSLASLIALMVETHQLSRRAQDAAVAEEKNRLAQELHDTLAGAFTGIFMQLQAANDLSPEDQTRRQSLSKNAEDLARTGLRRVREFVHTLAFSDADPSRVLQEMREATRSIGDTVRVRSQFTIVGRERRLKPAAANAFLRVLREALGNTQRYANAQNLLVTMQFVGSGASLVIRDDGTGFDVDKVAETGFGIPGMRARMHRLGGSLRIESAPGHGTVVTAELPDCCEQEPLP